MLFLFLNPPGHRNQFLNLTPEFNPRSTDLDLSNALSVQPFPFPLLNCSLCQLFQAMLSPQSDLTRGLPAHTVTWDREGQRTRNKRNDTQLAFLAQGRGVKGVILGTALHWSFSILLFIYASLILLPNLESNQIHRV